MQKQIIGTMSIVDRVLQPTVTQHGCVDNSGVYGLRGYIVSCCWSNLEVVSMLEVPCPKNKGLISLAELMFLGRRAIGYTSIVDGDLCT